MKKLALLLLTAVVLVGCSSSKNTATTKTYSGTLRQIVQDTPKPTIRYQLETLTKRYWVRWGRPLYIPPANSEVALTGQLEGETIRKAKVLSAVPRRTARRTLEWENGTKNIAWIAYTWSGTAAPWTKGTVESVTLTGASISVKKLYELDSFEKLKITGHVYGIYTVSAAKGCHTGDAEAKAKAEADGYVPASFTNVQYVSPAGGGCGFSGAAQSPGTESWIPSSTLTEKAWATGPANEAGVHTMSHELGHNFGEWGTEHANVIRCRSGETGLVYTNAETGCVRESYGNTHDTMGAGDNLFNAIEKKRLGWWESSQVTEVTESGNYTVKPDETNVAGTHLLEIQRPSMPSDRSYYYVEFHQPLEPFTNYEERQAAHPENWKKYYGGAWVSLSGAPQVAKGIEKATQETWLLYMNPTVVCYACGEIEEWPYQAIALPPGNTYTDSGSGLKLKTESVSAAGVVVKVTFPGTVEAPTKPIAVGVSASQVAFTWDAVPNATQYKVFRGGVEIGTSTKPHYTDSTGLTPNKAYTYCVKAKTAEGTSACSASTPGVTLTNRTTGGIFGWVTGELTPLDLAQVKIQHGTSLPVYYNTHGGGFYFAKELKGSTSEPGEETSGTQYVVKICKTGYFCSAATVGVYQNFATELTRNLGKEPALQSWEGWGAGIYPPGTARPYSPHTPFGVEPVISPFNEEVGAEGTGKIEATSTEQINAILALGTVAPLHAGTTFTHPVYYAQSTDEEYTLVYKTSGDCAPGSEYKVWESGLLGQKIKKPLVAVPDKGESEGKYRDHHLGIVELNGDEYDFWCATVEGKEIKASSGGKTQIYGGGLLHPSGAVTAASFALDAGIIQPAEIIAGKIDHAFFTVIKHCKKGYIYPAGHEDCDETTGPLPVEGARLWLDDSGSWIENAKYPPWKQAILLALYNYGAYIGDKGGSGFSFQQASELPYTQYGLAEPLATYIKEREKAGENLSGKLNFDVGSTLWKAHLHVIKGPPESPIKP